MLLNFLKGDTWALKEQALCFVKFRLITIETTVSRALARGVSRCLLDTLLLSLDTLICNG